MTVDEDTTQQRNWFESWMQATVLIELPDKIEEHYQELERPASGSFLQLAKNLGPVQSTAATARTYTTASG